MRLPARGQADQAGRGDGGGARRRAARQHAAVCRNCYIHSRVLSSYLDGSLKPVLAAIEQSVRAPELWAVEGFVMRLLEQWEAADARAAAGVEDAYA